MQEQEKNGLRKDAVEDIRNRRITPAFYVVMPGKGEHAINDQAYAQHTCSMSCVGIFDPVFEAILSPI